MDESESETAIRDLGLAYQLVTDYTSMVVLADDVFTDYGIERHNRARVAREHEAQIRRAQQPVRAWRVDQKSPASSHRDPSTGGGAVDPFSAGLALGTSSLRRAGLSRRRSRTKIFQRGDELRQVPLALDLAEVALGHPQRRAHPAPQMIARLAIRFSGQWSCTS